MNESMNESMNEIGEQKHIVIDARNLPTSTGRYVEMLVRYLEKIDTVNRYSVLMYPDKMDKWKPTNPNFTAVPCPHKEYSFAEQLGMKRQLDELQPDLVHFSMPQQPVLYRGHVVTTIQDLTTVRFRNPTKNPVIFWIKQRVYVWLIKRVARRSDHLIAISNFVKHDIAEYAGVPLSKITTTHEAADPFDEPEQPIEFFVNKQFIMGDGRPRPHKNLERQIKAFAKLHKKHPELYFMLTGKKDALAADFERRIADMGLAERVILTDFIPDGQLRWAMTHCQAYIWASLSEGFGLPPLEAMLNGAAVVSSNATCIPEVLGEAAHYFDPYDVDDIARAIDEVVSNETLQKELGSKGRVQASKYSWERMARTTLNVYNKVLDKK